jgi:hypothetical protein
MTFISIHSVIIYVVFFGACMRCTRLCSLKPGYYKYQEGRTTRQQQTEMNPPNPPLAGTDPVVAAQMLVLQHMTNMVNEIQNQIRQERQDRLEMRQEMRQARLERQQQHPLPPPPPPAPPSYINIYIYIYYYL